MCHAIATIKLQLSSLIDLHNELDMSKEEGGGGGGGGVFVIDNR